VQDEWGISDGYEDVHGAWHATSDQARARLRAAMGDPQSGPPMLFVREGERRRIPGRHELRLEDGSVSNVVDELPGHVPIGYHDLRPLDGSPEVRLVVHPERCPAMPKEWGVAVQVYELWSDRSWGIGDLRDVRSLAEAVLARGGRALLLSPLHQPVPLLGQDPSPYYPSTRRAWSPLLLSMDAPPPEHLRCHPGELIDRDEVWISKRAALEAEFDAGAGDVEPGSIAHFNALCDVLGADWRAWRSEDLTDDQRAEVDERARFHEWLQHKFAAQLEEVRATGVQLIGDLAVGFAPSGADAHDFRDLLAMDMRIGAPPDEFNTEGQNWGILPFVPWRVRAARYEPLIQTVRAVLRGMDGLRMDHVMGLFRQYWVPEGGTPHDGAYVRYRSDELLAILAIEATRAGAFVVGEDLGTVEPAVHEAMARFGIAGTKVLWFEDDPPSRWPEQSLATVTTHDLPTLRAVFAHVQEGDLDDPMARRLAKVTAGIDDPDEAVHVTHAALLESPARLRLLSADDLAGAIDQPNVPCSETHPNWRLRLPVPVDEIMDGL
jgi:4-alpha-glucanotransferase